MVSLGGVCGGINQKTFLKPSWSRYAKKVLNGKGPDSHIFRKSPKAVTRSPQTTNLTCRRLFKDIVDVTVHDRHVRLIHISSVI